MSENEDKKPDIAPSDGKINLRVRSQNGEQVTFQAKPTTKLSKLMKAYCERQMVDYASVVFSYDGQRLREDQTPGELDMEDNEFIDVLQHQVGGR